MSVYVGQECACNVCARWESTCIRQEEPTCRAPVRQEHACIVWVLVQAVPADLKCTHKAQTCAKGKRLFAGGKMLVPKLPCPPSCRVTCCPCSALLLTSHSFCRIGATGITQQLGQQCIAGPAAQWGAMGSKEGAPRPWEGAQSARRVGGISVF